MLKSIVVYDVSKNFWKNFTSITWANDTSVNAEWRTESR